MTTNPAANIDGADIDAANIEGADLDGLGGRDGDGARAGVDAAVALGGARIDGRPLGARHRPLRHAVHDEVRRRILAGEYLQGQRLYEDQIATELGVSRNPVREALQALSQDGFVELLPRRGARVARVPAARAAELFEVREVLEGLVARLAATRRQPGQLARLQHVVDRGAQAVDDGDLTALPALNTEFHRTLSAAAGNELLAATIERLADLIEWVYTKRIASRGSRSWQEHAGIVAAIADGDADRAQAAAAAHIANARAAYVELLTDPV